MKYFLLALLLFGANANAALMEPIEANGRLWLQPIDFQGLSWNDISAVCNPITGICSGTLNGNDMAGWVWASVNELNALFNYYIGSEELGLGPEAYFDVGTFAANFFADGWVPNSHIVTGSNDVIAFLRDSPTSAAIMSYFPPLSAASTTPNTAAGPVSGGWFVEVPSPATLPLIGLALVGLGWSRRKSLGS